MSYLLILTVGTGTEGKYSNLAQGLINTIAKLKPRLYWLVPSESEDSITIANLIRETYSQGFAKAPNSAFFAIKNPDDIFECRKAIREAIKEARKHLKESETLILNPTSGTKQMSAGATLAAIDEEIGEIVFTVGERANGVVKTGTERIISFSSREFLLERDMRIASELFKNGSHKAAAGILSRYTTDYPNAKKAYNKSLCMYEWHRMNYEQAAGYASTFDANLSHYLRKMANLTASQKPSYEILADILRGVDMLLKWNDYEEAIERNYKAIEYYLRIRMWELTKEIPPYKRSTLEKLSLSTRLMQEIRPNSEGNYMPGVMCTLRILREKDDKFANDFLADNSLLHRISDRNEYVHGIHVINHHKTIDFCGKINRLFKIHVPELIKVKEASPLIESIFD